MKHAHAHTQTHKASQYYHFHDLYDQYSERILKFNTSTSSTSKHTVMRPKSGLTPFFSYGSRERSIIINPNYLHKYSSKHFLTCGKLPTFTRNSLRFQIRNIMGCQVYISIPFKDKKLHWEEGGGCRDDGGFCRRSLCVLSSWGTNKTSQRPQIISQHLRGRD